MGTFHQDKHRLHGMTLVVDTTGPKVYIGRCDDLDDDGVVLVDVEDHESAGEGASKEEFIRRAALVGHHARLARILLPTDQVRSIRLLGEIPTA